MDSWRPEPPRAPSRHNSRADGRPSDRDSRPPWQSSNADNGMYHFKSGRDGERRQQLDDRRRSNQRAGRRDVRDKDRPYRNRFPPYQRKVFERPLLKLNHDGPEDPSLLIDSSAKFRAPDELTDSEEEDMAQSEEDDQVPSKRPRVSTPSIDAVPISKWSNPDPYTALPPVQSSDSTGKRTDVLKLIRKARLDSATASKMTSQVDDFISFDVDKSDSEDSTYSIEARTTNMIPPPPPPGHPLPPPPPPPPPSTSARVIGEVKNDLKRKRISTRAEPPRRMRSINGAYSDAWVQKQWIAAGGATSTPWFTRHDSLDLPGVALHKEILDFYDWVRPKDHEKEVRRDVFERLSRQFQNVMRGRLEAFGSYAAGLYLPTGDMDLVFFTRDYRPNRVPDKQDVQSALFFFARHLRRQIAKPGTVIPISRSKVPIVKFVDAISDLKVDLCFDNDTGVNAIETFQKWKQEFPVMPILVSIIKQFLMIRGLNDVANGGLGGFSTICLVTSLLQMYPHQHAGSPTSTNLGELLLEFFNLYGYILDRDSVVIRLDPPGYMDKADYSYFNDKTSRLTIIDPNRADNNISGGTHKIAEIQECFRAAYDALYHRLENFRAEREPISFLECLVGGDFTTYETQRQLLHELYSANVLSGAPIDSAGALSRSSETYNRPPVAHKKKSDVSSVDAPANDASTNGDSADTKPASKSERRATRLKELRPELRPSIGNTISVTDAIKLGGYRDAGDMSKDLDARTLAVQRINSKKKRKGL